MATTTIDHQCSRKTRKEIWATSDSPFRFVDSGLSDVYLVGIRYFECECGKIVAEIPAVGSCSPLSRGTW